ncbi:alkaline phosphatase-like [Ruditapes philippinarum]|uniref:alkaline phosphatase-like n=1 Tax=Ruditapes philippinarum TaxID=129788 RepID=UPI00295ACE3F|nr:alkaline phosphatase-like [Ruditapes philippinarum]
MKIVALHSVLFLYLIICLIHVMHGLQKRSHISRNILFNNAEKDGKYWETLGISQIKKAASHVPNKNLAKNIILFIGDGMGISTVTAARILGGQKLGKPGEEHILNFEQFEDVALSKTYILDRTTADSAASATALLCGAKTNYLIVGMDGQAVYSNCSESIRKSKQLESVLDWAQAAGKRTGIVTTARITHATPAAAYAKTPNRDWEGDSVMTNDDTPCKDIARQLVEDNTNINVLLGGGRQFFIPNTMIDPESNKTDQNQRQDGRNLITEWMKEKAQRNVSHSYVWNRDQFSTIDASNTDYLLGLFDPSHMDYDIDRTSHGPSGEPSLAEMVTKAINILNKGNEGFFLLVEGAKIDHGHHSNRPELALNDVLAMDNAIKSAIGETDFNDTLILVTADHSHVLDIAGYPSRGSNILGLAETFAGPILAEDKKPYTILQYSNGPGYSMYRKDLTGVDMSVGAKRFPSGIPLSSETHGAEDVSVYAKGPMSHLVQGVQEQTYFAYVMAYAACIGPYSTGVLKAECLEDRT